jgi:pyruvate/2-oxoglutarate dehydrogenase complex dihydrolipoamide acyltransferase (E2) component
MKPYNFVSIPPSRIATFDVFATGLTKHHVTAMLEFDVTESRRMLHDMRRSGTRISFNAWLIKVISDVLKNHQEAAAYLFNKKKLILFNDINISVLVEKNINGRKVPIPLVIEKTNEKSGQEITQEIEKAKDQNLTSTDIVLNKKSVMFENLYYHLPGFLRRAAWRIMLRNPKFIYSKMGNVAITSVGMVGRINGWFIHKSVHPLSFGVGSVLKKPVVVDNEIKIREILNMTILIDHDVIDGAPMVRFLNELTMKIERGSNDTNLNPEM